MLDIEGKLETDRAAVGALLSNYYAAVDDKRVGASTVAAMFTVDATWNSPGGTRVGREAILEAEKFIYSKFRATHHASSDHIVEVDGDTARFRANMIAMHVWAPEIRDELSLQSHFLAGGVFTGEAVRTSEGWRFQELTLKIIWREGWMPLHLLMEPAAAGQS